MPAPGKFNPLVEYDKDGASCVSTHQNFRRYGFESKLVLRDPQEWTERTILVPLGELEVKPTGCHVRVRVKPSSNSTVDYVTYTINDTLGRLDCAAEPIVIYKKAQIHAVTSSVLQPDRLTGRTGTEEALDLLASAISQRKQLQPRSFILWGENAHHAHRNASRKTNLWVCSMDAPSPRCGIGTSFHRQAHTTPRVVSRRQAVHEDRILGLAALGFQPA